MQLNVRCTLYVNKYNTRARQFKRFSALALEKAVNKDAVLAIANNEEPKRVRLRHGRRRSSRRRCVHAEDLQMIAGDEAGPAHVDVDVALAAATTDRRASLAHRELKVASFQASKRHAVLLACR